MPARCGAKQISATTQNYNGFKNYAARIVIENLDYVNFRIVDLLHELDWASFIERWDDFSSVMIHKAINWLTPQYTTYPIAMASETHDRGARPQTQFMGLLPDTQNCGLRMRRECRERFPRHRLQRKPIIGDPGMHHGTRVTHVLWCMSGSLTGCDGCRIRTRITC